MADGDDSGVVKFIYFGQLDKRVLAENIILGQEHSLGTGTMSVSAPI